MPWTKHLVHISEVPGAIQKARFRALEGHRVSSKSPSRVGDPGGKGVGARHESEHYISYPKRDNNFPSRQKKTTEK